MCCEQSFIDLSIRTNEQQKKAERRSDDVGGKRRPEQRSTFIFIFNEARDEDRATRQSRGLDTVLAKKRYIEMEDPRQLRSLQETFRSSSENRFLTFVELRV